MHVDIPAFDRLRGLTKLVDDLKVLRLTYCVEELAGVVGIVWSKQVEEGGQLQGLYLMDVQGMGFDDGDSWSCFIVKVLNFNLALGIDKLFGAGLLQIM